MMAIIGQPHSAPARGYEWKCLQSVIAQPTWLQYPHALDRCQVMRQQRRNIWNNAHDFDLSNDHLFPVFDINGRHVADPARTDCR